MERTQIRFLRRFPRFLRLAIMTAASLVVLFGLIALIVWQRYQLGLKPVDPNNPEVELFVVDKDQKPSDTAKALEDRGLIKSSLIFEWYLRIDSNDGRDLQRGSFEISRAMSIPEIVDVLEDSQASNNRVTIFPGHRLDEIADSLEEQGFDPSVVATALDASRYADHPVARWWPEPGNQPVSLLEGYLYPETFNVTGFEQDDIDSIVRRSLDEFARVFKDNPDLEAKLAGRGLTVHQAVIFASIVAQEAERPDDMAKVAQVFFKRYNQGAVLGADPPVFYAYHVLNRPIDFHADYPYNTRRVPGLPPTPISNFGDQALLATANPAATDYYFFVAGDDGTIYFNQTLDGHNRDANLYCHEACRLPTADD